MRERQLLERARKAVDLSHTRFGAHLVKNGHRRVVRQRLIGILGCPDHWQQANALGDGNRECGPELGGQKRRHEESTGAPAEQVDACTMKGSCAGSGEEKTPIRFAIHALVYGIENRRDALHLIDHDPARNRRGVQRLVQTLWLGGQRARYRSRPQVQKNGVGEALLRVRGLPGAPRPEEERAARRGRAEPSNARKRGNERCHRLIIDANTVQNKRKGAVAPCKSSDTEVEASRYGAWCSRSRSASLRGGSPNSRAYSRLNWLGLA